MSVPDQEHVSADGHLKTSTTTANGDEASNELVAAVDNLIDLITEKFTKVTGEILAKLDDMAQRLDELEASINAGADNHEGNQ